MKKNILLTIRHLVSDKVNSVINIIGLVLGLGIVMVILVFVLNEFGYNQSFANKNRIYRILNEDPNNKRLWANTPFILGETLENEFAEVETCIGMANINRFGIKTGEEFLAERNLLSSESAFFDMFGISLTNGTLDGFDEATDKILISKSLADKYFPGENAVGKIFTLRTGNVESPVEIAGIFNDFPKNSTIQAAAFVNIDFGMDYFSRSMISTGEMPSVNDFRESWLQGQIFTNYLLLAKGISMSDFQQKLSQVAAEHSTEKLILNFSLQPLNDIYFHSAEIIDNYGSDRGNLSMVYILISIGLLILIIACINYMNLTTAQAAGQTRALAMRKICGAPRSQLIGQMIFQSVLISLIALPFAIMLAGALLPFVSSLLGKSYELTLSAYLVAAMAVILTVTVASGAFSGFWVALRATSLNIVETLKMKNLKANSKNFGQKALVIFQIFIFIILSSSVILMQKQIHYAFNKDLGFAKEGLIRMQISDVNYEIFKAEALKSSGVQSVSGALWLPPHKGRMLLTVPKVDEPEKEVTVYGDFTDYGFAETMGMKIILGSDFEAGKISSGVLVNETAVRELGLTDIIGESTPFGQIIGVVSDFNMYSLHEAVPPMIIGLNPRMCREIAVRINTDNMPATIDFLKEAWEKAGATTAFDFGFTDNFLQQLYESEMRFSKLIGILALSAIFIAGMGLFGLSLLVSKQKTKEIGIRKVNGAKIVEIIGLLNRGFILQALIAFVVAVPVAWLVMSKWLESFAYKTEVNVWIFVLAGIIAFAITLLSVSWQSWRAATRNPVEALRYE